jgi:hypothetical protein
MRKEGSKVGKRNCWTLLLGGDSKAVGINESKSHGNEP